MADLTPYAVHRDDLDDGSIVYSIYDERPETYRFVCGISDASNPHARRDAETIVHALNTLVACGMASGRTIGVGH